MTATVRTLSPTPAPAHDLPEGLELSGRYRVRGELARGGMGIVYLAEHLALGREVAVKTLHPRYLHDPHALERFEREARAAASIGHPGIVHVFDLGSDHGISFLVMERLHGEDLRQRIAREGALPIELSVEIGAQLAAAIAAAHHRGIIHRDLSPRNVFLAHDALGGESVKVLDFGIAKLTEPLLGEHVTQSHHQGLGTLMYMAPERVADATASGPLVDVYAIGALLYEAITGTTPYPTCAYHELALKVVLEQPAAIRTLRAECPAALAHVVERAMHKEPVQRWPSAALLGGALREALAKRDAPADEPPAAEAPQAWHAGRRRRGALAAAAVVATAVVVVVVGLAPAPRPAAQPEAAVRSAAPAASARPASVPVPVPRSSATLASAPPRAAQATPAPIVAPLPAAPTEQSVDVVTEPAGATVGTATGASCRAPCTLRLPADENVLVRARLRGYRTAVRRIAPPLPERVTLRLEPAELPSSPGLLPPLRPRR